MYEYIIGTVEFVGPQYIVVENNGIGYQIFTPNPYVFSVDQTKQKIYTYFYVRDDANVLYGFKTREQKLLFAKLLTVSGIGPKGALAILASGDPVQIVQAIEQENESFLIKFPGIGKKTSRQIILDLKGKLKEFEQNQPVPKPDQEEIHNGKQLEEALLALEALGYTQKEIKKIIPLLEKEKLTTDQYIKLALQLLIN